MPVLLVIAVVIAVWIVVAVLLALVIGRAAHIAEVKHRDEVFLRQIATPRPPALAARR